MLSKLSMIWSNWLIQNGANPEDRQIYEYGAECFLSEIVANAVVFIIAFLFHFPLEMLVWQLFWLPLRLCIGGYHSPKNHATCIIISTLIAVGCVLVAPLITSVVFTLPITLFSVIIVIFIAPVLHPNHPITKDHKQRMKKNGEIIFVIEITLITILYIIGLRILAVTALSGVFAASALCLIGNFTNNSLSGNNITSSDEA